MQFSEREPKHLVIVTHVTMADYGRMCRSSQVSWRHPSRLKRDAAGSPPGILTLDLREGDGSPRTISACVIAGARDALRRYRPAPAYRRYRDNAQRPGAHLACASCPAWLIGIFAGIAALLSAIGLYGVIHQTVS